MDDFLKKLNNTEKALRIIPKKMGIEAVRFTKQRFVRQDWIDDRTENWPKRRKSRGSKRRDKGAILVDSGRLKRSVRVVSSSFKRIVIGTDVLYASAHNEGFRGTVKVPKHTRNMRTRAGRKNVEVQSYNKKMNLPRRRFLGPSSQLGRQIERIAAAEFNRALKGN